MYCVLEGGVQSLNVLESACKARLCQVATSTFTSPINISGLGAGFLFTMKETQRRYGLRSLLQKFARTKRRASSPAAICDTGLNPSGDTISAREGTKIAARENADVALIIEESSSYEAPAGLSNVLTTNDSPTPYKYDPINEAAHEIRLLTILPDEFSAPVRVCLHTIRFAGGKEPNVDFEALSYAWGSQDTMVDLLIGESCSQTIKITPNLGEALPYLRYQDASRIMWIDAICVNQRDLVERSNQVRRMADIFSLASRVVIWLGPAVADTALAVKCFKEVSENIVVDWDRQVMTPTLHSEKPQWADRKEEPIWSPENELAIFNVLKTTWFTRLWIWQEVALAIATLVMCGSYSMSWKDVQDTVFACYCKTRTAIGMQYSELLSHLYDLCRRSSVELNIDSLLESTKYALCSDPRDKIFALFSLFPKNDHLVVIDTDYTKSASQIYMEFARNYIKLAKSLRILLAVDIDETSMNSLSSSWVPNWSSARKPKALEICLAAGFSAPSVSWGEGNTIQLSGCRIGTIDCVKRCGDLEGDWSDLMSKLSKILLNLKQKFEVETYNLQSLCRVLCGGRTSEAYLPARKDLPSLLSAEKCMQEVWMDNTDDSKSYQLFEVSFIDTVRRFCNHRNIFKFPDGNLGLGPSASQPGDIVVVWLGCDNPMILRPSKSGSGRYSLVGEAYCDGFMYGEAILGPLPEHFGGVIAYREQYGRYVDGYIDRSSEKIQWEDPRLSGIPPVAPWKLELDKDGFPFFRNLETGEKTWADPRLSPGELKKRGTELEVFEVE